MLRSNPNKTQIMHLTKMKTLSTWIIGSHMSMCSYPCRGSERVSKWGGEKTSPQLSGFWAASDLKQSRGLKLRPTRPICCCWDILIPCKTKGKVTWFSKTSNTTWPMHVRLKEPLGRPCSRPPKIPRVIPRCTRDTHGLCYNWVI